MNMNTNINKVAVIGCGIAGPAVALFLKRIGWNPVIYEAAPTHDDYAGLFLNVGRNGLRVLKELGIDEPIRSEGFEMRVMRFRNGKGKPLGEVGHMEGEPQGYTVKRGFLHRVLRDEVIRQQIPLVLGAKLVRMKSGNAEAELEFENGMTETVRFVVGCDGIHSSLRKSLLADAPQPQFTGLISIGGFSKGVKVPYVPGVQQMVFGNRAFFGYIVQPSGEVFWFGNEEVKGVPTRKDMLAISQTEWHRRTTELYKGDDPLILDIIRSTQGDIGAFPIYDMPPQPTWHKGPAVLIGDAVHATSPNAGQGASMALEDAMMLTKCIRDIDDLELAFTTFRSLRHERVERIVRYSRTLGQRKYASNRVQAFFRDTMMPLFLKSANKDSHGWMYDYRIDWEERVLQNAGASR